MLRFIKKIEVTTANHLQVLMPVTAKTAVSEGFIPFEDVPIIGLAQLTTESDCDGDCRLWTTRLSAQLACGCPHWAGPVAFRLTDVNGRRYHIGLSQPPHPVWNIKENAPSRPSEHCGMALSVEWTDRHSVLELLY